MMILRLLTVVVVLLIPELAPARSATVRLVHRGDCPTAQELGAALRDVGVGLGSGRDVRWIVEVTARRGEALTISLRRAGQQMSWKRSLRNSDCAVLAKAAAIILHAHFVSLGIALPTSATARRPSKARTSDAPAQPRSSRQAGRTAVAASAPSVPRKRRDPTRESAAPRPWRAQLSVGLSGGINLAVDPQLTSAIAQLDVGIRPFRFPLSARLVFNASSPTTQENLGEEVRIQQLALRLDLLLPLRFGALHLTPTAGVGAELLRVWAKDLVPDETHLRVHPLLALGVGLGYQLGRSFVLRLEATFQLTPSSDNYLIGPVGRVARSPKASGLLTLGLLFAYPGWTS